MPAYYISQYTIHDVEAYQQYARTGVPIVAEYGGRVLAAGASTDVLEGEPHTMNVLIEFESMETAKRWYHSAEYQAIIGLRQSSTDGWAVLAQGAALP